VIGCLSCGHLVWRLWAGGPKPFDPYYRVRFCEEMLLDNGRKLLETFYSDEMGIYLSEAHLTKIWHKRDKEMEIEIPKGKVRVSVWGAISFRGATSLHILEDKLDQ